MSPDHRDDDGSEHIGPGSFHSTLADFVTRVRFVPRSMFPCCVLTSHHRIQDGAPVPDRSHSSGLQRHHSVPYSHSPRRGSARDVFHLSYTHRGATNVQQSSHEWGPQDLVHTPEPAQRDPSHDFVAFMSSNNSVSNPPPTDTLPPHIYGFSPPTGTEFSSWFQSVYPHGFFRSRPDIVSGEAIFPQNSGPSIHPSYSPYFTGRVVSTVEQLRSKHIQSSRSRSQGPPLIANQDYVRYWMLARWRCLILDISQNSLIQHSTSESGHDSDFSSSPGRQMPMFMVPQRQYAKMGDHEQESIVFKVNDRLGIPARDAIGKIYAGLEGRDNRVSVDKSVMMLRVEVRPIAVCEDPR